PWISQVPPASVLPVKFVKLVPSGMLIVPPLARTVPPERLAKALGVMDRKPLPVFWISPRLCSTPGASGLREALPVAVSAGELPRGSVLVPSTVRNEDEALLRLTVRLLSVVVCAKRTPASKPLRSRVVPAARLVVPCSNTRAELAEKSS